MLKREQLILAVAKSSEKFIPRCENAFNKLLQEAMFDYNAAIEHIIESEDNVSMEIFANFTDLLNMCISIEQTKNDLGNASNAQSSSSSAAPNGNSQAQAYPAAPQAVPPSSNGNAQALQLLNAPNDNSQAQAQPAALQAVPPSSNGNAQPNADDVSNIKARKTYIVHDNFFAK